MNTSQWIGLYSAAILNFSLQTAVVLAAGALALVALRRQSAATRFLVAVGTLAAVLLLPALNLVQPPRRLSTAPARVEAGPSQAPVSSATMAAPSAISARSAHMATPSLPAASVQDHEPSAPAHLTAAVPAPIQHARTAPAPAAPRPFDSGLAVGISAVWLLGACIAAIAVCASYLRLALLSARFPQLESERLSALVVDAARQTCCCRPVVALQDTPSTPVPLPITWGWRRPALLLPRSAETWPTARLRAILLHEFAHIRRCDWAALAVARIACVVAWFNPLAWLLLNAARIEAERACDDAALMSGLAASDYAGHLVETVRMIGRFASPAAAISIGARSDISTRVESILSPRRKRRMPPRGALVLGGVLALTLLTAVSVLRPIAAAQPKRPQAAQTRQGTNAAPEIQTMLVRSCMMPVIGPGVELTLPDDRNSPVTDVDVLGAANALKAAGAEALAICGQRLTPRSAIRAVGADITVNGSQVVPPYIVRAIGDAGAMERELARPGGFRSLYLARHSAPPGVARSAEIRLPGTVPPERRWSHAVAADSEGDARKAQMGYFQSCAGLTERTGPGIRLVLRSAVGDSPEAALRPLDLLIAINQLRTAGAEEIAVGDQRVTATSAVEMAQGTLRVNGVAIPAPVQVAAIGDPSALRAALSAPAGIVFTLQHVDRRMAEIQLEPQLRVPAARAAALQFARTAVPPAFAPPTSGGPSGEAVTLSDGTTVELIGVGNAPLGYGEDWWRPDGTTLRTPPVQTNNRFHNSSVGFGAQYLRRALVFRLRGRIETVASTTGYVIDPSRHLDKDGFHHGRDLRLNDTRIAPDAPAAGSVQLGFLNSDALCTYRFGIATGPWETVSETRLSPELVAQAASRPRSANSDTSIMTGSVPTIYYANGPGRPASQPLLGSHAPLGDVARRVVALDASGSEIPLEEGGVGYDGEEYLSVSPMTLHRIAALRLETRPYLWAEFHAIHLQPTFTPTEAAPIATPAPSPGFSHTFSNGLTLSVIGVTEPKVDGGRWWLPDGRRMSGPVKEFRPTLQFVGFPPESRARAILTLLSCRREVSYSEAIQILPASRMWPGISHMPAESGMIAGSRFPAPINADYPPDTKSCRLRLGIAAGPWKTQAELPMPADVRRSTVGSNTMEGDLSLVLSDHPGLEYIDRSGGTKTVSFLQGGRSIAGRARRIVAIDRNGKVHTLQITASSARAGQGGEPESTEIIGLSFADSGRLSQYNRLDLMHVRAFRLQTRPYEWTETPAIRLDPGH